MTTEMKTTDKEIKTRLVFYVKGIKNLLDTTRYFTPIMPVSFFREFKNSGLKLKSNLKVIKKYEKENK